MNNTRFVKFRQFYILSILIVIIIMVASFVLFPQKAAMLMQNLMVYFSENKLYPNVLTLGRFAFIEPLAILIFLFAAAPSISALILKLIIEGKKGAYGLLRRFKPILSDYDNSDARRVYFWIFLIYLLGAASYILFAYYSQGPDGLNKILNVIGSNFFLVFFALIIGIFIDEGGLLEELGWRGLGLHLLVKKYSPLVATLILGFLWWFWHLPRDLGAVIASGLSLHFVTTQSIFLLLCLALSIVISFCVFKTGGSVLPAILIHGGTNVWSKALSKPVFDAIGLDVRTIFVVLLAVALLFVTKGKLGYAKSE